MGPGVRMTRRIESSGSWMSGKTMQDEDEGITPISIITNISNMLKNAKGC